MKSVSFASGSEVPKPPRPAARRHPARGKEDGRRAARGGDGYGNFPAGASSSAQHPPKQTHHHSFA